MTRKRMVLWDWNGCLLDDVPHRFEHGPCAIFKHFGLPPPTLDDYSHNISSDFMRWYYERGIPDSGDKKRDGDMLNAIMRANMATAPMPPLFPESRDVVRRLRERGLAQVLVSALEAGEFARQLDHHGMRAEFQEVRGGIRQKSTVFREMLEKNGVEPAQAVGITDMMHDVHELIEVGVQPILVPRGYITPDTAAAPSMIVAEDLHAAIALVR